MWTVCACVGGGGGGVPMRRPTGRLCVRESPVGRVKDPPTCNR